jgi:hypothetical protein
MNMAGKIEKEEKKEIVCFVCEKTEHQGVLPRQKKVTAFGRG